MSFPTLIRTAVSFLSLSPWKRKARLQFDTAFSNLIKHVCVLTSLTFLQPLLSANCRGDDFQFNVSQFPVSASGPVSIVSADFNGDGVLDLVTGTLSVGVTVLIGNGDGTFQAAQTFSTGGTQARGIAASDLNNDGIVDLVVANTLTDDVSILLGAGDGTFTVDSLFPSGDGPIDVVAYDFDQDGNQDIAVANAVSDDVSIFFGLGDGAVGNATNFDAGDGPGSLVLADFNLDGEPDLATCSGLTDDISILTGQGNGAFSKPAKFLTGDSPEQLITADFNGDGNPDLATVNSISDDVSVLIGNGDGTFANPVNYPIGSITFSFGAITSGDFNVDGIVDIVVAVDLADSVAVLRGIGDGTFKSQIDIAAGNGPRFVTTADFDGDGINDLATVNNSPNVVTIFVNDYSVLLGDINRDCEINLNDVEPFIDLLISNSFQAEADTNQDGAVDLLDVAPFVDLLVGS